MRAQFKWYDSHQGKESWFDCKKDEHGAWYFEAPDGKGAHQGCKHVKEVDHDLKDGYWGYYDNR